MTERKRTSIHNSPFKGVVSLETETLDKLPPLPVSPTPGYKSNTQPSSDLAAASLSSTLSSSSIPTSPLHHHTSKPDTPSTASSPKKSPQATIRSRRTGKPATSKRSRRKRLRRNSKDLSRVPEAEETSRKCCRHRSLYSCMNVVAKMVFWMSTICSVAAVVWYSYELKNNGAEKHLIAWFSAGAFVLLGFPISMYGIVMHLANYNQPNVQCYVIRILWMVPLYSIESWLCLRYKDYAIYIETLRDCYESYVLYSFLQFLIQVLGGEEALILMLKDKSPTRGVHMWGLQWCVKPWLMGQPIRKSYVGDHSQLSSASNNVSSRPTASTVTASTKTSNTTGLQTPLRPLKRVHWTSPFFVKCKFGVLQYVLLKFICSLSVMILERNHIYKEGDFTWKGGYLYICILTNVSQCWALYCLIFFYYATKNELASIRPVGKFLSVKALVFFTWWQSVCISMLYQMDLIGHYHAGGGAAADVSSHDDPFSSHVPLSQQAALALDEFGGEGWTRPPMTGAAPLVTEWSAEDVAKGIQDYLICIEMFIAAMVHIFVFPHTEYDAQAVEARERALNQAPHKDWNKRLGRKWKEWDNKSGWSGTVSNASRDSHTLHSASNHNKYHSDQNGLELTVMKANSYDSDDKPFHLRPPLDMGVDEDDLRIHPLDRLDVEDVERRPLLLQPVGEDEDEFDDGSSIYSMESGELHDDSGSFHDEEDGDIEKAVYKTESNISTSTSNTGGSGRNPGFVRALLDSAIPQDLRDNTVGIIKGDYVVEKKTLLHHAATSDSYDLFSRVPKLKKSPLSSDSR